MISQPTVRLLPFSALQLEEPTQEDCWRRSQTRILSWTCWPPGQAYRHTYQGHCCGSQWHWEDVLHTPRWGQTTEGCTTPWYRPRGSHPASGYGDMILRTRGQLPKKCPNPTVFPKKNLHPYSIFFSLGGRKCCNPTVFCLPGGGDPCDPIPQGNSAAVQHFNMSLE